MAALEREAATGKPFDIQPYMTKFTFSFIVRVAFGEELSLFDANSPDEKYLEAWDNLIMQSGILAFLERGLGKWALNLAPEVQKKVLAGADTLHQLVFRNIERREKGIDLDRSSIFDDAFNSGKVPQWMIDDNYGGQKTARGKEIVLEKQLCEERGGDLVVA